MVFARFVSEARNEPPDIDVDFEHERREEVIQHIYEKYGRHRAGLCATVIHYRGKRAIREVGAAMGLSVDTVSALSSQLWGWGSSKDVQDQRLREIGLDPADPAPEADPGTRARGAGLSAASVATCGRVRDYTRGGLMSWCPSRMRRWKTGRLSAGTRTTSTRLAS